MTISRNRKKLNKQRYKYVYINRYVYDDVLNYKVFSLEKQVECMAIFLVLCIIASIVSLVVSIYLSIY